MMYLNPQFCVLKQDRFNGDKENCNNVTMSLNV
jgi:hypothetical protein